MTPADRRLAWIERLVSDIREDGTFPDVTFCVMRMLRRANLRRRHGTLTRETFRALLEEHLHYDEEMLTEACVDADALTTPDVNASHARIAGHLRERRVADISARLRRAA